MRYAILLFFLCTGFAMPAHAACKTMPGGAQTCDGNATITTGNTAQNLFGAIVPTNGFALVNPDAAEPCWFSQSATAAANATGSQLLPANGGWYETPPGMAPMGVVSIVCATTGHKLTAYRW